ncbi:MULTISPECIES: RNA-guided endonuclease InsQ/TnpB family protein [Nostocales]|uniref:RNA-guided endonuclease InsQ/TnpB family protein n=1 Tax=Nostocales TaxID=1161 RepID=UPI0004B0442E|nr:MULTISPECIES: transposase [Nostocales]
MLLSFKTQLIPNNRQVTAFRKSSGVARHAYNWANAVIIDILKTKKPEDKLKLPSAIDLHKRLVAEVKSIYPWYYEVSKNVPQKAIASLRQAWDRCLTKTSFQARFKKKGQRDSFYLESGTKAKPQIKNDGKRIKLPTIGWVRLSEPLPITATHNCVISRQADRWFIAIKYEIEKPTVSIDRPTIGVDIGINELAVCSNGKVFSNPKAYRRMSKSLKRSQRRVSRRIKGSKNRIKAIRKLAKIHAKVSNIRKDAIHKLTNYLAKNHSVVSIEDLQIKAFLKNHKLAGAIADCGMYEFKRQLEYKTEKFDSKLILVDRFYPSSQICSNCFNHRHKMPLKNRVYICPDCGHTEDRDLNAAKNIDRWFENIFIPEWSEMVSSTKIACGVDKPLRSHPKTTVKQEVSTNEYDMWFWSSQDTEKSGFGKLIPVLYRVG